MMKKQIHNHLTTRRIGVLVATGIVLAVTTTAHPPPPPPPPQPLRAALRSDPVLMQSNVVEIKETEKGSSASATKPKDVDVLLERFNRVVDARKPLASKEKDVTAKSEPFAKRTDEVIKPVPVAKRPLSELMNQKEGVSTGNGGGYSNGQPFAKRTEAPSKPDPIAKRPLSDLLTETQPTEVTKRISKADSPPPPPPPKNGTVRVQQDDDDDDELVLGDAAAHAPPTLVHRLQQQPQKPLILRKLSQEQRPPPPPLNGHVQANPQKQVLQQQQRTAKQQPIHRVEQPQQSFPAQRVEVIKQQQQAPAHQHLQRLPPQYQRPQQQHYRHHSTMQQRPPHQPPRTASLFQSLWTRVEQGLDSLANVEEMVTDRASQLTSQVTSQARDLLHKPTSILSSSRTVDVPIQPQQQQRQAQVPTRMSSTTTTTKTPPNKTAQHVSNSLASLYGVSATTGAENDSSDDEDEASVAPIIRGPWEEIGKPIARAGASDDTGNLYGRKSSPFTQLQMQTQQRQQQQPQQIVLPRAFATVRNNPQQQHPQPRPEYVRTDSFDSIDDRRSWTSRVSGMLPSLPRMPSVLSKLLGRGSGSLRAMNDVTLDVWKEEERSARKAWFGRNAAAPVSAANGGLVSSVPPLKDLLSRCNDGKSTSLLSNGDIRDCRSIGNKKAVLDFICFGLIVVGVHQLLAANQKVVLSQPRTISVDSMLTLMVSVSIEAAHGWAFYALVAAFFTAGTNRIFFDGRIRSLKHAIAKTIEGASQYSQLYMRLVSGQAVDKHVPDRLQQAARAQTAELVQTHRMHTFVTIVVATMVVMTVSVVQRILFAISASIGHAATLPELYSWPIPWKHVGSSLKEIIASLGVTIQQLVNGELSSFLDNPMAMGFQLSVVLVLLAVAFIPTIEHRRKVRPIDEEEEEDLTTSAFGSLTTLSNLGVSSASRLGLLSKSGAIEGTLERWRATLPPPSTIRTTTSPTFPSLLRYIGYSSVSTLLLLSPVLIYLKCFAGVCSAGGASSGTIRFDSIWDVSILLLFMLRLSWKTVSKAITSSELRPHVQSFVRSLGQAVHEASGGQQVVQTPLGSAISLSVGLSVRDLWVAHASKRAWAVRGASFDCKNGEVLAILGDDGAGKTRLVTSIAETIVHPSKGSLTTTKVRGSVSVGGLDANKWDRHSLKKRLGLFLNDVRTVADIAVFMSGFTLEEILEPMDGLLHRGSSTPTASARAVNQAMQIMGLNKSLLPRLPGKMSTAVTANEQDLIPSELRPRCHSLSPSEWSKVLLARVLAQTIFDNDNISNSPLVGSLLILDDLTMHLSEVEELTIIQELRKTGAATVFTSHKWASGRLADRVVVVKEGSIVESGTHTELLARGPQQSIYAAKWHAMSTG